MKTQTPGRRELTLDEAIEAVRAEDAAPALVDAASRRVWQQLAGHVAEPLDAHASIRGCDDVVALLPGYRVGTLSPARTLLVDDHLRECATCRAAYGQPGTRRLAVLPWRTAAATDQPPARPTPWRALALAAALLLTAGVSAFVAQRAFFAVPPGVRAAVQSASGVLQLVANGRVDGLLPGREVGEGETIRTGRDSQAVLRLQDGSLVEMSERAELSVRARGQDTTIHLERGRIIVQAAKRTSGFLRVASRDCTVKVTGTVFSVNGGLKGSRVSVIEGHVRVDRAGQETSLERGEQWTSSKDVGAVPLREELAWSRDVDRHLALLGELRTLRAQWETVPKPGLRHESHLLHMLPHNAVIFAAMPNYGETLGEAQHLFERRLNESAVLRDWWNQANPARHGGPKLESVVEAVRSFASFLGNEVALAVTPDALGRPSMPLFLAEVQRPGLREFIEERLAEVERDGHHGPRVRFLDETDLRASGAGQSDILVLLGPDLIAISGDATALRALSARLSTPGAFEQTPFGQRIAAAYENGVGLLFAADLEHITSAAREGHPRRARQEERMQRAGIDDVRHLLVELKDVDGHGQTSAQLSFRGARHGIASWLAAPAPMGSLDFFSPNAQAVGAFVFKSPALLLDDVLSLARIDDPRAERGLAELESKLDLRVRADVAETLGGEVALALDGPLLPTPAWKLALEVYDPVRLQTSIEVLVRKSNEAGRQDRGNLRLEAEDVSGQTFYTLSGRGRSLPFELHYTFAEGYLVAAGSRAIVAQALRIHSSGASLGHSASFRALFPADGRANVSGLVYQNFGPAMGTLLDAAPGRLSPEQRRSLEALAGDAKPSLLCAFGGEDQIQVASIGGLADLDPSQLALSMLLPRVLSGTAHRATP